MSFSFVTWLLPSKGTHSLFQYSFYSTHPTTFQHCKQSFFLSVQNPAKVSFYDLASETILSFTYIWIFEDMEKVSLLLHSGWKPLKKSYLEFQESLRIFWQKILLMNVNVKKLRKSDAENETFWEFFKHCALSN